MFLISPTLINIKSLNNYNTFLILCSNLIMIIILRFNKNTP